MFFKKFASAVIFNRFLCSLFLNVKKWIDKSVILRKQFKGM